MADAPPLLHHLAGLGSACSSQLGCTSAASVAAVFLTAVPITHAYGGHLLFGASHWNPRETFVRGGSPFLVLQTLAWAFWAVSVLFCAWVVLRGTAVAGLLVTELAGGGRRRVGSCAQLLLTPPPSHSRNLRGRALAGADGVKPTLFQGAKRARHCPRQR